MWLTGTHHGTSLIMTNSKTPKQNKTALWDKVPKVLAYIAFPSVSSTLTPGSSCRTPTSADRQTLLTLTSLLLGFLDTFCLSHILFLEGQKCSIWASVACGFLLWGHCLLGFCFPCGELGIELGAAFHLQQHPPCLAHIITSSNRGYDKDILDWNGVLTIRHLIHITRNWRYFAIHVQLSDHLDRYPYIHFYDKI